MLQDFKRNFDQPVRSELATDPRDIVSAVGVQLHEADSLIRNICFVWADGRKAFFNYAYLVSVDLLVSDATNILLLCFGSYTVTVRGYQLSLLFDLLIDHQPKTIMAGNARYLVDENSEDILVTDIQVKYD
ncbi:hypothetical protein ACAW74_22830 [Fibrella sp. WM1]|uniref:hypothetical protein n=1 Tax=Fibrella musci TaxID=3242485 RepID=UPI00352273C1